MSTCPNCKKTLSCGCQRRNASNNTVVCTSCLSSYELTLKTQKSIPIKTVVKQSITNLQNFPEQEKDRYNNLNKFIK